MYAKPSSNTILPTVPENMKYQELPAAVTTIPVPFAPNVRFLLWAVPMAVPDTTPVTAVLPASLIPIVTSLTNIANMDAPRQIPAASARPANQIRIAVRRRFPATTDVPRPTPAVSAPLVRAILTAT